jgi:amidase
MRRSFLSVLFCVAGFAFHDAAALAQPLELTTASISELNAALDAGRLTSERLVELCLARIEAYDEAGPELNAVITVNPQALDRARALDTERRSSGPRSPLHGIPIVLKDNLDTADIPTTAGSFMLAGSLPPDDAFLVRKLRGAGAIVLAKLNMSEFASGDAISSLGGITRNPHDPARTPSGSSGGTGAAIAAAYAPLGLGTDTGGSVRGPSSANGIVGLKPTLGLLSRDGIVPLALSFDTAGPMARHVEDVAIALGVMVGVDPSDGATRESEGNTHGDYTQFLDNGGLNGARIGIARQFLGHDPDVDWIVEASIEAMKESGATAVDVEIPAWLLRTRGDIYWGIRHREFRAQIPEYLRTLGPDYPKTVSDLIDRSLGLTSPSPEGYIPNPSRWNRLKREDESGTLEDPEYLALHEHGLPMIRTIIQGIMDEHRLDAIVYPTAARRAERLDADPAPSTSGGSSLVASLMTSPTNLANLTGFPDLIVPAGFTSGRLPVTISFLGRAFSEPRLLALGYAFEQATRARRLPVHTPPLPGETIS